MALPAGQKLEIDFGGSWTDVSAYVYAPGGLSSRFGRTSEYSQPGAASFTCVLDNDDGRFTPQRQILADGTTTHPYWPNIIPECGIRYSYTIAGTKYYRFTGVVKAWQPQLQNNGEVRRVQVQAIDALDQLGRYTLTSPIAQETVDAGAALFFPLSEPAGSVSSVDATGTGTVLLPGGPGAAVTYGVTGPGTADGTALQFSPSAFDTGKILTGRIPTVAFGSVECWFRADTTPAWYGATPGGLIGIATPSGGIGFTLSINSSGYVIAGDTTGGTATYTTSVIGNGYHHVAVTRSAASAVWNLYIDGQYYLSSAGSTATADTSGAVLSLGDTTGSTGRFAGIIGDVALYPTELDASVVAKHYAAGFSYAGDTTTARAERWITASTGGIPLALPGFDPGVATVGSYPQAGKTVLQACQDMATTEGGGAAFYVLPDGTLRFCDRNYRRPASPVLTVDAGADLDQGTFQPSLDDLTMVDKVTVDRSDVNGSLSTQTVSVPPATFAPASITTYTDTDSDALYLAQYSLATQATPGYRLPQVTVDLLTATSSGLYQALAAVQIGDRIRVTNLDPGVSPTPTLDVIVEGWSETVTEASYMVTFDTSPADNPAFAVFGGTSDYSRFQASGMTVGAMAKTTSPTTMVIATSTTPLTVNPAVYPLTVQVDEEIMTIASPPISATSPQTVTATRAQGGTPAAAHSSGAVFNLYPAATFAL